MDSQFYFKIPFFQTKTIFPDQVTAQLHKVCYLAKKYASHCEPRYFKSQCYQYDTLSSLVTSSPLQKILSRQTIIDIFNHCCDCDSEHSN